MIDVCAFHSCLSTTYKYTCICAAKGQSYYWTWGAVAPSRFFYKKFSIYIKYYFQQFVSIKLHFAPLNNIIDIFNAKKNISPTTKIKPKQHPKQTREKKKSKPVGPVLIRYLPGLEQETTNLPHTYNKREERRGFLSHSKKKKKKGEEFGSQRQKQRYPHLAQNT